MTQENSAGEGAAPHKEKKKCLACAIAPFVLGFALAIVFGWWCFPRLIMVDSAQPVEFTHKSHVHVAGMNCSDCHKIAKDGSFSAYPKTAECARCHNKMIGTSDAEHVFYNDYVRTGKEVTWKAYQKQPDNVFFSHAPHSLASCNNCHSFTEKELCSTCHPKMAEPLEPRQENPLTGYTKYTMKMWQCERCHAQADHLPVTASNNACFTCHK